MLVRDIEQDGTMEYSITIDLLASRWKFVVDEPAPLLEAATIYTKTDALSLMKASHLLHPGSSFVTSPEAVLLSHSFLSLIFRPAHTIHYITTLLF